MNSALSPNNPIHADGENRRVADSEPEGTRSNSSAITSSPLVMATFTATGVAVNRGADFVKHLVPSRRARQNKALDPTALAGW